jgi:hypothetical protein
MTRPLKRRVKLVPSVGGRERPGRWQRRIARGNVSKGSDLQIAYIRLFRRVDDLKHELTAIARPEVKIGVALAREIRRRCFQPEDGGEEPDSILCSRGWFARGQQAVWSEWTLEPHGVI